MLACTGVVVGRRARTKASASGERSTPTTAPWSANQAPFPPGPHPASSRRSVRWSHGASRSAASARVLRYHQWSSSTAAMRAYSSSSTRGEGTWAGVQGGASAGRDAHGLDDEVGRRPRLHADPVTAGAVATAVGRRLLQVLDGQDLRPVDL